MHICFSYCYEDEDGIHPEVSLDRRRSISSLEILLCCQGEFLYDLQLPTTFVPKSGDQEMDRFYLWTIPEVSDSS